jgi:hypothetical protein
VDQKEEIADQKRVIDTLSRVHEIEIAALREEFAFSPPRSRGSRVRAAPTGMLGLRSAARPSPWKSGLGGVRARPLLSTTACSRPMAMGSRTFLI